MREEFKSHPSFGQLSFHRTHGPKKSLYGSSLKHSETICMTLYSSKAIRELHETTYLAGKELFEVAMSPHQFAEVITSLNIGRGNPTDINNLKKNEEIL